MMVSDPLPCALCSPACGGQHPRATLAVSMIIVSSYPAGGQQLYRIEVRAVPDGERYNADVRIRRLFSEDKGRLETVTCNKLTPDLAEAAGELWAKRWIDTTARPIGH